MKLKSVENVGSFNLAYPLISDMSLSDGQYECNPDSLVHLNQCSILEKQFGCDTCSTEFVSYAPAWTSLITSKRADDEEDGEYNSDDI